MTNDGYLEVWLWLVSQHSARQSDNPPWLAELADDWHTQATEGFGFGVVAALDRWLVDDDRRRTLRAVFAEVRAEWVARGRDFTTTDMVATRLGGEGVIHDRDYPHREILATADAFIALIADEPRLGFVT